ncbi:MAG TPA: hypothetical protein VM935_11550 [Chitinophagaceae bacterium]|jgi:uncharacterized protein involved in exopolysaccharide biosynthesis|nr:hypothetical protein [Chitinophagaceae bacterium]
MVEKNDEYYSLGDIMTKTRLFLRYLAKRLWLVLLAAGIGAGIGAYYYGVQKPKYEGICTFILEEKQSGLGGLGSIASQFGLDMGGMGGGGIFSGDNILDILKSRKIVQQVLLTQVDSTNKLSPTLADIYLDFSKLKKEWKKRPDLTAINFRDSRLTFNQTSDSVLNIVYKQIIKKNLVAERVSKKGTIIEVKMISENDTFSKLMTERLVQEAGKMYLLIKVGTAQQNIYRMQRRSDSLLSLLNNKSYTAAASQLLDVNPGLRTAIVPVEIATRDKTVIATLYTEVTKNLELSKLMLSQQTPVIQLLDRPGLSLFDNKRSLSFLIFAGGFIALTICLAFITVVYFLK